jgi:hypothetical protein
MTMTLAPNEVRCPFGKCWGRIYIDATREAEIAELNGRMQAERETNLIAEKEIRRLKDLMAAHNARVFSADLRNWVIDFTTGALVK